LARWRGSGRYRRTLRQLSRPGLKSLQIRPETLRDGVSADTLALQELLCLRDGVLAEVKNTGGQYRLGSAFQHAVGQVLQITYAARRDNRDGHGVRYRTRQRQVKAFFGAVAIHACKQ